jgi:thiol:disulfide interchange protein DsbA
MKSKQWGIMYRVYISFLIGLLSVVWSGIGLSDNVPAPTLITPMTLIEGKNYQKLGVERTINPHIQSFLAENPNTVQVIEFFNYGCAACKWFHPVMAAWAAKQSRVVTFVRVPVVFNKKWETLAKAYFVTNALSKNDVLDTKIFEAIHDRHTDLSDETLLKKFFTEQGVSEKAFSELFYSFDMNSKLTKATTLANAYQVTLSPIFIVNGPTGSYWVTPKMVSTQAELIQVVDALVVRESKQLAGL